jgi:hypothetical protein
MSEVLGVIEPVADQKLIWCIESDKFDLVLEVIGNPFVQQRTDCQRSWLALSHMVYQTFQRLPRIDDVFDEEDVFSRE